MKNINAFIVASLLSILTFSSQAKSISAQGSTLDEAEAQIAAQAAKTNSSYKIIEANMRNRVHMTAQLQENQ